MTAKLPTYLLTLSHRILAARLCAAPIGTSLGRHQYPGYSKAKNPHVDRPVACVHAYLTTALIRLPFSSLALISVLPFSAQHHRT